MEISGIDKDFINIINYLNEEGFKPWASCDGVLANHTDPSYVTTAYIAFLKSSKIIELMATFLRDKEIFTVALSNNSCTRPYYLYGNLIKGNSYCVYFPNKNGEMTSYLESIVMQSTKEHNEGREEQKLLKLSKLLEDDEASDLNIGVTFNSKYPTYMKKTGRISALTVRTKAGCGYERDMSTLANMIYEKFGTIRKNDDLDETFAENEFVVSSSMNTSCEIYFEDEHFEQILEQINYIKSIEHTLPTLHVKEADNYWDDYYEQSEEEQIDEPIGQNQELSDNGEGEHGEDALKDINSEEKIEQHPISGEKTKKFGKDNLKKLAESRMITRIKKIYSNLKEKFLNPKKSVPENIDIADEEKSSYK